MNPAVAAFAARHPSYAARWGKRKVPDHAVTFASCWLQDPEIVRTVAEIRNASLSRAMLEVQAVVVRTHGDEAESARAAVRVGRAYGLSPLRLLTAAWDIWTLGRRRR